MQLKIRQCHFASDHSESDHTTSLLSAETGLNT